MDLPDISRFRGAPPGALRALGARLDAIGLNAGQSTAVLAASKRVTVPLRRPILKWHLRRTEAPWALAMRLFAIQDPLTLDEARAALGALVDPLLNIGLLTRSGGDVVSPFVLHLLEGLYVLGDDLTRKGDAVMALSGTTVALAGAAAPASRGALRCLDLGCGAGALALKLARSAREAVGTDINPRALEIARVNAAINGVSNVEFREGSLFEPVKGETFDLIVSQPPFVPRPPGAAGPAFLHGGARGDELALDLLARLPPHLAERGRALLMMDWPEHGEEPLAARIRRAVPPEALDLLLLTAPATSPDEHAANYAAGLMPALDDAFERDVMARREHLERTGIRGFAMALLALERPLGRPGWTDTIEVRSAAAINVTSARVDKLMAARSLPARRDQLLSARLRMPEGMRLSQRDGGPDEPTIVSAAFPDDSLAAPIDMSPDVLGVLSAIHDAPDVRAGVQRFAETFGAPMDEALGQVLPAIEHALRHGLLEVE